MMRTVGSAFVLLFLAGCLLQDGYTDPQPHDDLTILAPGQDWPMLDEFDVVGAEIKRDVLTISVAYSGGCREHTFSFYSFGPVLKTLPPGADLWIRHDADGDLCEAYITQDISVDVRLLRAQGYDEIRIHVLDFDLQGFTLVAYTY